MSRSQFARRLGLILSLFVFGAFAGGSLAEDPQTPEELRQAAAQLEATARENLASGIEHLRPSAEMFRELAISYRDEAAWREEAAELEARAERAKQAGDAEEAERLLEQAISKSAEATVEAAERGARQRQRTAREDLRAKLEIFLDRARILRQEGEFADAEQIESQVREQLRAYGLDPRYERAADLRMLALKSRFDGAFDDAAMYDREADRLLSGAAGGAESPSTASSTDAPSADDLASLRAEVEALRAELAALKATIEESRTGETAEALPAKESK